MSRKDYKKAAELVNTIINKRQNAHPAFIAEEIAAYLIELFSKDNPRFNAEKFLDACGLVR